MSKHTSNSDRNGPMPVLSQRHFVPKGTAAHELLDWSTRDARIVGNGEAAFEQTGAEFPAGWSDTAVAITLQKYARRPTSDDDRETSLRQIVGRVTGAISRWGLEDGYFSAGGAKIFEQELSWLLYSQKASFNSPVWFNIGVDGSPQQASACFILSVDDSLASILDWHSKEGRIFQSGSGSGVNLSALRGSAEPLSAGGTASGPVSFMRGADASAGAIKSGGRTRRAAKMVLLDDDHPDVMDFIRCKASEEEKARALAAAGFDMSMDSPDADSIGYRNANHSVRLSDAFMKAVAQGEEWQTKSRVDGSVTGSVDAAEMLAAIAEAAHACGDPGVQFTDTVNRWHTIPNAGPINGSNPCSEYMSIDDSACNLASVNLLEFASFDGDSPSFDTIGFKAACRTMLVAQDILVTHADYPTPEIGVNARRHRQLGLGFTNLGAMLMSTGLAYDSKEARLTAGAVTALMGGAAYAASADMAERLGPFEGYHADGQGCAEVIGMHADAFESLRERHAGRPDGDRAAAMTADILTAAAAEWERAVAGPDGAGLRNSQTTLLAPTGTISFMMDCDTLGIEPDFALKKGKQLVGGGVLNTVNGSVRQALRTLGYDEGRISQAEDWLRSHGDFGPAGEEASPVKEEHLDVFSCAVGHRAISPIGHMKMMSVCQPFLSGAISKTVNVPAETTAEQIEELIKAAHVHGIKALAVYRYGSKAVQPLTAASEAGAAAGELITPRRRLPACCQSRTRRFSIGSCKGYLTAGEYDDGSIGEVFINVAKEGSLLSGMLDAFAMGISHSLQHGTPLRTLVRSYQGMQFEPNGITDDPDIRFAQSIPDYVAKRLALDYLDSDECEQLGIASAQQPDSGQRMTPKTPSTASGPMAASAPVCTRCGWLTVRSGSCWACSNCGATSGCS